jgi:hypothetical protein
MKYRLGYPSTSKSDGISFAVPSCKTRGLNVCNA